MTYDPRLWTLTSCILILQSLKGFTLTDLGSPNELSNLREQILKLTLEYADLLLAPKSFTPGSDPIPVSGKVLTSEDFTSLVDSSLDGWLTAGRFTVDFERQLAQFVGARSALFVNSGSSANLVALSGLTSQNLGRGR